MRQDPLYFLYIIELLKIISSAYLLNHRQIKKIIFEAEKILCTLNCVEIYFFSGTFFDGKGVFRF